MQNLVPHCGTANGSEVGRGSERSHDDFKLPYVHLFEQFAASASPPQLELRVIVRGDTQHDEVRTQIDVDVLDNTSATPVEAVGDPQDRRELPQAVAIRGIERSETCLRRFGIAAAMMPHERREECDLCRVEAAQLAVLDE